MHKTDRRQSGGYKLGLQGALLSWPRAVQWSPLPSPRAASAAGPLVLFKVAVICLFDTRIRAHFESYVALATNRV